MGKLIRHILVGGAAALLVSISYLGGLFFGIEHFFEDLLVSEKPVDSRIVILAIDDESLSEIGQWPWPREVFASAFIRLEESRPLAVGFDVVLSEPSRVGKADDQRLTQSLKQISYPIVFPVEGSLHLDGGIFRAETLTEPLREFLKNEAVETGHVNLILDPDGVVRRLPLEIESSQGEIKAMSYLLAEIAGAEMPEESRASIVPIIYSQAPGSIRRISFSRFLKEDLSDSLRGKIMLVGVTVPDLHDEKPTPFSKGTQMTGVEIQANALNMFLQGYELENLSKTLSIFLIFLAVLLPALFFSFLRSTWRTLITSIGFGILLNISILVLHENGLVINIVHTNLAWLISLAALFAYRYFVDNAEKRYLRKAFSKYVSGQVLDKILSDPKGIELGGEEKVITVLFSDIRGFTTLSEKLSPEELVKVLNKYFTLMTGEVLRHKGVLDKYIGDAVMAFWGAPLDDDSQADNALKAALGMLERLKEFNEELKHDKGITIDIGIGLYNGPAVVGNIGSDERFDYTAMGDTVNVASRLEGLNKEHGTHIILGESVKNLVKEKIEFKSLGSVQVKGRDKPLSIYTL